LSHTAKYQSAVGLHYGSEMTKYINYFKQHYLSCKLQLMLEIHVREFTQEEEEEIYLAQTQQIKCKYKSYTIQLSRVTGKPEGQLCRPP